MPPKKPHTPTCPRCAYDQSGAIATWTDSCPLQGTCPECGLCFDWCDVLRPEFRRIPWLYEHAEGLAPRALVRSLACAAIPTRFWSHVRLAHRISPFRLLLMLGLAVVSLHLATSLTRFAATVLYFKQTPTWVTRTRSTNTDWAGAITTATDNGDIGLILKEYGLPFGRLFRLDVSEAISALTGRPSRWLFLFHILAATLILALPHTRAIAKVRPIHLLRAAAYPIVLTITLFYLGTILGTITNYLEYVRGGRLWFIIGWAELLTIPLGLFYALWWWRLVCTRYLKLPSPHLVWVITMGVALFGTIVLPPVNAAIIHKLLFGY